MHATSIHATEALPPYFVMELERDPNASSGHDHVIGVATRDPDGGETRWSGDEVVAAIRAGERFVVAVNRQGGETLLEPATCPACPSATLIVRGD